MNDAEPVRSGPLVGVRIVELGGIGPGPFAGMMLADMGADVVRVVRPGPRGVPESDQPDWNLVHRGRRSIAIDIKRPEGVDLVLRLVARCDGLIEGFRPGVTERAGLGPEDCMKGNDRLVYGRMTGWGQDGPMAGLAGHDLNYLALSGTLHALGREGQPPTPPQNLLADYGGGGMLLAFGMVCGLLEARVSGRGQVIDAAMVDGAALLATMNHAHLATGAWQGPRGTNLLDTGAPFYEVYETADGAYMSVAALEPKFYAVLREKLGITEPEWDDQRDSATWRVRKLRLAEVFRTRTREEWCDVFRDVDACVTPVLTMIEAQVHPHNIARRTFVEVGGTLQPAPAPRFSRTPGGVGRPPVRAGWDTAGVLRDLGITAAEEESLRARGIVG